MPFWWTQLLIGFSATFVDNFLIFSWRSNIKIRLCFDIAARKSLGLIYTVFAGRFGLHDPFDLRVENIVCTCRLFVPFVAVWLSCAIVLAAGSSSTDLN